MELNVSRTAISGAVAEAAKKLAAAIRHQLLKSLFPTDTERNSELLFDLPVEEPLDRVRGVGVVTLISTVADKR